MFADTLRVASRHSYADLAVQVYLMCHGLAISFLKTLQMMNDEGMRPSLQSYDDLAKMYAARHEIDQLAEV